MIVDATIIGIKRRALEFSANCHAKRQFYVHYESIAFCIDLNDLKCEFQVEESWGGLAHDFRSQSRFLHYPRKPSGKRFYSLYAL